MRQDDTPFVSFLPSIAAEKGKPVEKRGRKASRLPFTKGLTSPSRVNYVGRATIALLGQPVWFLDRFITEENRMKETYGVIWV